MQTELTKRGQAMSRHNGKSMAPSHTPGTLRGEELIRKKGPEPGRTNGTRTARDSTSINAKDREPIDSRMPHLPPP
jgi:hypothetical protein